MKTGNVEVKNDTVIKELESAGFRLAPSRRCHTYRCASDFAEEFGFPVVLKLTPEDCSHKTEVQGVQINIHTHAELQEAYEDFNSRFPQFDNFIIQKQIAQSVELLVGLHKDPTFGHCVICALGGVFTEIIQDVVFRVCPIDESEGMRMLSSLKMAPLLDGYRSMSPVNKLRLAAQLAALSRFPTAFPQIGNLELNPLLCNQEGEWIVDYLLTEEKEIRQSRRARQYHDVSPFFRPSSVAVVGASQHKGKGGYIICDNLQRLGYNGRIFPVNPHVSEILGLPCFASLHDLPAPVDCAIIIVPRERVLEVIDQGIHRGISHYIICTAGFSDVGDYGDELEKKLVLRARQHNLSIMGPNSIGTIDCRTGFAPSITHLEKIPPGHVTLLGQSGVFSSGWARMFSDSLRPRLNRAACLGNKSVIDEIDFLKNAVADPNTRVIGMYLEGVRDGGAFLDVLPEVTIHKPLIVMKAGNSEGSASAISTHTGALAIDEKVFQGLAQQYGLCLVSEPDEFFDTIRAFELLPRPQGRNVGIISISGMGCVLGVDFIGKNNLILAELQRNTLTRLQEIVPPWAKIRNPADIWAAIEQHGPQKAFESITSAIADDPGVDALILIFVLINEAVFDYERTFKPIIEKHPRKPFLAVHYGGTFDQIKDWALACDNLGIPVYSSPASALKSLSHLIDYTDFCKRQRKPPWPAAELSNRLSPDMKRKF